jgi:hypothetical protein
MIVSRTYKLATGIIIAGVVMLCQPFSLTVYTYAVPVFLVGVVLFVILDHLPNFEGKRAFEP